MRSLKIFIPLLLSYLTCAGQSTFELTRKIDGINENGWYKLELPNQLYSKINEDLSDLRIMGTTSKGDTIESAYTLQRFSSNNSIDYQSNKIINRSKKGSTHYFTLEMNHLETINSIDLDVSTKNFDWNINLEGSHDLKEWFSVIDNYRIIGISNSETSYHYTRIKFPDSKYSYYRISFPTNRKPRIKAITSKMTPAAPYQVQERTIEKFIVSQNQNKTEIQILTNETIPISELGLIVKDTFDYYRPIKIHRLKDSIKTQVGWQKRFELIYSGIISSFDKDPFYLNNSITSELKIEVSNFDNEPLDISSAQLSGRNHTILFRVEENADYSLYYGNSQLRYPHYDIDNFINKIPKELPIASLGPEKEIINQESELTSPLFENKLWLWLMMGIIILVLGVFSIKMLNNAK